MAVHELIAALYFVGLAISSTAAHVPRRRQLVVAALAFGSALAVAVVARQADPVVRAWAPHGYLAAGYWLPALLVVAPVRSTRFERWLAASDMWLRGSMPRVPSAFVHVAELAYLLCYPLIPVSFTIVFVFGTPAAIGRFWVAVLVAGYACYASLPWLVSRPPRLCGGADAVSTRVSAINARVLRCVSHQLNTFPSGHVAVAIAAAAVVLSVFPAPGVVILAVAIAIAIGAVIGRYHYVTDVLWGVVVAAAAVLLGMRV